MSNVSIWKRGVICAWAATMFLSGCARTGETGAATVAETKTLTVAAHDSFAVSEEVVKAFEEETGARVQFLALGDAGAALNKMILAKDAPLADVFYGVDNTFLSRAIESGIFEAYESPLLVNMADDLEVDADAGLLPVDTGFVTLNADAAWFEERGIALPQTLDDLLRPEYKGLLVVENPATSSPGLAFLLATIDHYGEEGWKAFWEGLKQNDVQVSEGWSEAYYQHFTVGSDGVGDRPLAVSYTTSPPADVLFATDGRTKPASVNVNLPGGVFRQVEYVGVIKGGKEEELARQWVDFMLDTLFQNDLPLQMFVYPANEDAQTPALFDEFAATPEVYSELAPEEIEANRERWIGEWTDLMGG